MDVLSAAMEAAAAAEAASSAPSSVASSPRAGSPTNSTSTKDGTAGGGSSSANKAVAEIHEARLLAAATAASAVTGGGPAVPAVSQAIRDAHAKLEAQAEDIRNGQCGWSVCFTTKRHVYKIIKLGRIVELRVCKRFTCSFLGISAFCEIGQAHSIRALSRDRGC